MNSKNHYSPSLKGVHSTEKNHDTRSGALNIDVHQAGLYTAFSHDGLHLSRDVLKALMERNRNLDGSLHSLE